MVILDVTWPSGRIVPMRVRIISPLADVSPEREVQEARVVYSVDSDVLESEETLMDFLADATRIGDSAEGVKAICFEPNVPRLMKLLGVEGPPPERILVELPEDAGND